MPQEITVNELKEKLDADENFVLIDCRESDEYEYCCIDKAKLIPLSEFQERAPQELKKDDEIFIHCHHGGRSMKACLFLESLGYEKTTNVAGGIDAWSLNIDPKIPRY